MATEFDNLRDASIGSDIGDTVTVDGVEYVKTAGEEGSGVTAKLVPKQASTSASSQTSSITSSSTGSSSSGIGGKYLKDGVITYKALNINDLPSQEAKQAIIDSDRHTVQSDGSITFTDEDGSEQYINNNYEDGVASVDFSNISSNDLVKAADLTFLAQNGGVKSSDMNAVYESLGLDPNDSQAHVKKDAILRAAGYTPGDSKNFYGSNQAQDPGAQIIQERWQSAPTEQDMIDAGLDPSQVSVVNSNVATSVYLAEELAKRGIDTSETNAYLRNTSRADYTRSKQFVQDAVTSKAPGSYWDQKMKDSGLSMDDLQLDMLEWDLIKKKAEEKKTGGTGGGSGLTGTINTGGAGGVGTGMPGGVGSGTPYTGPNFVSTPNIGNITPVYGEGQTGLTEVDIPTYEAGLGLQQKQFDQRAIDQAAFYKPQTLEEQQAAGTAPAFENVLYRNRFGMSMYVQHINGVPSQPIPPGYYRVQGFGTEAQTQGGSAAAAQGQNQGGVIRSFQEGGVNPALNYQPGGTVVQAADGTYKIKYPDGTYSQAYDTAMNANAANNAGLSGLGLPDYATYLQQQGIDMNLPGYDEAAYQGAYQSYITDPATLENIKAQQQQQEEVVDTTPQSGSVNQDFVTGQTEVTREDLAQYQANLNAQAYANPGGAVAASPVSYIDPNTYGTVIESTAGQALATAPMVQEDQVAQIGSATTADVPIGQGAATYDANQAYDDVSAATEGMTAATSTGPTKTITAEEQKTSSVSGLDAATGESVDVTAPDARTLETIGGQSELITGTGVDQSKVMAAFGEGEIKAASVQDELTGLMQQFEGGDTPAWAAGSMRAAMATLAARGLGASSMAGQAVIQAAMEAALPIAQIDASNKQQMALFKGEQRAKFLQIEFDQAFQAKVMNAAKISEIANMNFTAEQQIALENSKAANTMALQNLSNEQALVMAEAAALSQLDTQNLNNRQQAAVQNAQNFLQIDMANLANEQATALFKQQSLINSILSDQAAANAAAQFNATSENQTNQFFSNLAASVNQFNAAQMNAMKQFNADEVNSLLEFNASMQNQREMFNAQNYLVVAQANAQWRQNLATINTAAANESNMAYTQAVNGLTMTSLDEIWQRERDILSMAFQISENNANRANEIVLQKLAADASTDAAKLQADIEASAGAGDFVKEVFLKIIGI